MTGGSFDLDCGRELAHFMILMDVTTVNGVPVSRWAGVRRRRSEPTTTPNGCACRSSITQSGVTTARLCKSLF